MLGIGAANSAAHVQQPLMQNSDLHWQAGNREIWAWFWPRRWGVWGLFLVFIPKKQGAEHGCTQRAEQLLGGQSAVLVVGMPEQEGADRIPVPLGGGVCGLPTLPENSFGLAMAPNTVPAL